VSSYSFRLAAGSGVMTATVERNSMFMPSPCSCGRGQRSNQVSQPAHCRDETNLAEMPELTASPPKQSVSATRASPATSTTRCPHRASIGARAHRTDPVTKHPKPHRPATSSAAHSALLYETLALPAREARSSGGARADAEATTSSATRGIGPAAGDGQRRAGGVAGRGCETTRPGTRVTAVPGQDGGTHNDG
jgi:hypothetical protein